MMGNYVVMVDCMVYKQGYDIGKIGSGRQVDINWCYVQYGWRERRIRWQLIYVRCCSIVMVCMRVIERNRLTTKRVDEFFLLDRLASATFGYF